MEDSVTSTIRPLHSALGAEVCGVNLAIDIDPNTIATLRQALVEYSVIVLRNQCLEPAEQVAISKKFGPLMVHVVSQFNMPQFPEVLVLSNDKKRDGTPAGIEDAGRYWHTDMSYLEEPSLGSILHAIEVPPEGGETMFASMHAAYDAMTEERREQLARLRARHFFAARWQGEKDKAGVRPAMTAEQIAKTPPVEHPLIRTHPESGRKALYAGGFATGIVGLEEQAGRSLIDEITSFSTQPQFVYTHKWQAGDLVFWDNRSTMHHALTYDSQYRRHMHRTTIKGDRPC